MVFCQYNYKNFHNENRDKRPIQPYNINNWCKMVNDNDAYCKNFNWWKWVVFYFWYCIGRFKYIDLPSNHPYWKEQVRKDIKEKLKVTLVKYTDCKKNPEKIKYHFNIFTSLKDVENTIAEYKQKLK